MNERLSFLIYAQNDLPAAQAACASYLDEFSKLDSNASGEQFSDVKALFIRLSEAVKSSENIVLAVSKENFIRIKGLLFAALKTNTVRCADIERRLNDAGLAGEEHILIPASAIVLPTLSGEYSGFIERRGSQTLIFLPADTELAGQLAPVIDGLISTPAQSGEKQDSMQELHPADERGEVDPGVTARLLREKGVHVAVASAAASAYIFSALPEGEDDFSDVLFYQDVKLSDRKLSQREYITRLAGQARRLSGAELGVSISNVFLLPERENDYFMFVCVADSENARLFKIYSRTDESINEFASACVMQLYSVLGDYAESLSFVIPDDYDPEALNLDGSNFAPERSSKKIAVTVSVLLVLALLIGVGVTMLVRAYGSRGGSGASNGTSSSDSRGILDVFENFIFADIEPHSEDFPTEEDSSESAAEQSSSLTVESQSPTSSERPSTTEIVSSAISVTLPTVISTVATTEAPATKAPTANEKPTSSTASSSKSGTFTFTVYGYGHGVGMSQNGANTYASKNGWNYERILLHYYAPGVKLVKDSSMPKSVSYNGKSYSLKEYLSKTACAEAGASAPTEALKAQIVAIYTYAKRANYKMTSSNHAFNDKYNYEGTTIEKAVNAVLGEYLEYNGSPALTPYFSTSAGKTTSCENVWGGSNYPYLQGGRTSPEGDIVRTLTMTSEELRAKIEVYNAAVADSNKIVLQDDPAQWIKILEHDKAVSSNVGYISSMQIGNRTMRGNAFRLNIMGAATLRSHCFSFKYKAD